MQDIHRHIKKTVGDEHFADWIAVYRRQSLAVNIPRITTLSGYFARF